MIFLELKFDDRFPHLIGKVNEKQQKDHLAPQGAHVSTSGCQSQLTAYCSSLPLQCVLSHTLNAHCSRWHMIDKFPTAGLQPQGWINSEKKWTSLLKLYVQYLFKIGWEY